MAGELSTDTRQALITILPDGRHTPASPLVRDIMAKVARPAQAGWLPAHDDLERARREMVEADAMRPCDEAAYLGTELMAILLITQCAWMAKDRHLLVKSASLCCRLLNA